MIVHGLLQTRQVINSVMLHHFLSDYLQFTSHKQSRFSDSTVLNIDNVQNYEDRSENKLTLHRHRVIYTRVGTIYLQLIQNRYMFRSFTVLQCSHQHCVQPVASDVEAVGYL